MKGSCLCKKVSFAIDGAFNRFFLCHCSYCRKDTGSAHCANLFANGAKLTWLTGDDNVTVFNLEPTRHTKSFCKTCGSALPTLLNNGEVLMVPAGCLDEDIPIKPNAHIFMASRANWDENLEKVKKLDNLPE